MWILFVALAVLILLLVSAGLFVVWRYWLSIKVTRRDEVAIMLRLGKPQPIIHESGPVYVPWVPIKWDKHYPWELVRIPTKQLPFNFEGKVEQRIWSKDRQMLLVDISGYVRFPFKEPDSLALMIKSGVPTEEAALQEWMEKEVVSGLRDIMAGFDHKEAIGRSNISAIRTAAMNFFLQPTGLFARSGLCGNDPQNFTVGTGEVIIRIDTVNPTAELQKAMEAPVVATYQAEAAKHQAETSAILFDDTNQSLQTWLDGQRAKGKEPTEIQIEAKQKELEARAKLKSPGYQELHIKGLEGATTAVVGGGGGAGILVGGGNPGKNPGKNSSQFDAEKAAQEFFDKNGVWPSWDPKGRGPKKP